MQQITFSRHLSSFLNYWIVVNLVIFCGLVIVKIQQSDYSILGIGILTNVILLLVMLSKFRLRRLTIDQEEKVIILETDKWFLIKRIYKIPLSSARFTFNVEHRARGMKAKVLKIYKDERMIIEVVPGLSGWKEKDIIQMIKEKAKFELGR